MKKSVEHNLELSDEEIMIQMAKGDPSFLEPLYLRYGSGVLQLLCRSYNSLSAADADDICQDVFLTVYKNAPKYVHMGKLRSWIYKIALREAKAQNRKRWLREKLFQRFVSEKKVTAMSDTSILASNDQTKQRVATAISQLTPGQRQVLTLAIQEGMSGKEIAQTLGLKHNAVRVKLYRARRAIAVSLDLDATGSGEI